MHRKAGDAAAWTLTERDLERHARRERERSTRRVREEQARRTARRTGAAGVLLAAALPVALWHRTASAIASEFSFDATYLLTGWSPFLLMALGLLCALPALARLGAERSRFYGASPAAWSAWAACLYLLGFALAAQVSQLAHVVS